MLEGQATRCAADRSKSLQASSFSSRSVQRSLQRAGLVARAAARSVRSSQTQVVGSPKQNGAAAGEQPLRRERLPVQHRGAELLGAAAALRAPGAAARLAPPRAATCFALGRALPGRSGGLAARPLLRCVPAAASDGGHAPWGRGHAPARRERAISPCLRARFCRKRAHQQRRRLHWRWGGKWPIGATAASGRSLDASRPATSAHRAKRRSIDAALQVVCRTGELPACPPGPSPEALRR